MSDKPGPISAQVSPEYRKECLEMALRCIGERSTPETIVEAAKKFYAYIHEGK